MLAQLSIDRFAIIEHADIRFTPGFNVLSGETGAGKSILIDALGLVLGNRADAAAIRPGQDSAAVRAIFHSGNAGSVGTGGETLSAGEALPATIRRVLRQNGSKAYLNDRYITGQKLKQVAAGLVSVHGQHSNQTLLKSEEQRRRLDRYGKLQNETAAVGQAYEQWQDAERQWQAWQQAQQNRAERLSLLAYQVEELEAAAPGVGEFQALSEQQNLLAGADELLMKGEQLSGLLRDSEQALSTILHQALRQAQHLAASAGHFSEATELLEQSVIYLDEAADSLQQQLGRIEHDPAQLARVEERMSVLHTLARKHKVRPEALAALREQLNTEYQSLSTEQDNGSELEAACTEARRIYEHRAAQLTQARKRSAPALAEEVQACIRQLGMEKAVFVIEIQPAARPAAHGQDNITYTLCANPGQKRQALAKVASGGELSRISLALEVACLDDNPVPTVIFDEIDTGIGGEVADTVGRLLYKLGKNRQVLCITHLPQVAAYADTHYRIEKSSTARQTETRILPLDEPQRISEIARMLGAADSETGKEHAKALLAKHRSLKR